MAAQVGAGLAAQDEMGRRDDGALFVHAGRQHDLVTRHGRCQRILQAGIPAVRFAVPGAQIRSVRRHAPGAEREDRLAAPMRRPQRGRAAPTSRSASVAVRARTPAPARSSRHDRSSPQQQASHADAGRMQPPATRPASNGRDHQQQSSCQRTLAHASAIRPRGVGSGSTPSRAASDGRSKGDRRRGSVGRHVSITTCRTSACVITTMAIRW